MDQIRRRLVCIFCQIAYRLLQQRWSDFHRSSRLNTELHWKGTILQHLLTDRREREFRWVSAESLVGCHTVDGSEIPRPTTWDGFSNLVNNGTNHQAQLVIAGFLNHHQYYYTVSYKLYCYSGTSCLPIRLGNTCEAWWTSQNDTLCGSGSSAPFHPGRAVKVCEIFDIRAQNEDMKWYQMICQLGIYTMISIRNIRVFYQVCIFLGFVSKML